MLKAAALTVALLAVTAVAAEAQTLSSIPPNSAPTPSATAQPYVSTQKIVPEPGSSVSIKSEHYQPSGEAASGWAEHPYSGAIDGKKSGPKPN